VLQTPPRDPQKRTSAVPRQEGGPGLTISTSSLLHQHTCMRLQGEGHTMHHSIHQTRKATHHKQGISGPCPPFHWPLLLPLSCPLALFVGPFPFHLPFHLQAPLALPSSCPQPPPPNPCQPTPMPHYDLLCRPYKSTACGIQVCMSFLQYLPKKPFTNHVAWLFPAR
jgi:hypothetical protein